MIYIEATPEGVNARVLSRDSLLTENYKMVTDTFKEEEEYWLYLTVTRQN